MRKFNKCLMKRRCLCLCVGLNTSRRPLALCSALRHLDLQDHLIVSQAVTNFQLFVSSWELFHVFQDSHCFQTNTTMSGTPCTLVLFAQAVLGGLSWGARQSQAHADVHTLILLCCSETTQLHLASRSAQPVPSQDGRYCRVVLRKQSRELALGSQTSSLHMACSRPVSRHGNKPRFVGNETMPPKVEEGGYPIVEIG